jgi:enamine deaminase RidA (YjgF/YER057c/UK114 family)
MDSNSETGCIIPKPSRSAIAWKFQARAAGMTSCNSPESLEEEIAQTFRNVERTLAAAGASWEHVVHVNSYHVGGFPDEVNETISRLYRQYMPNHAPIWTELGVEALAHPDMHIEIRVTAIIP